jgi:hypothetical protein
MFKADKDGTIVWEFYFSELSTSNSSWFASTKRGEYAFEEILYVQYPRDSVTDATDEGILTPYFVIYLKSTNKNVVSDQILICDDTNGYLEVKKSYSLPTDFS